MIIGFTGRAGAGKSTAAEFAMECRPSAHRASFARPIKLMMRALLTASGMSDYDVFQCLNGDMKEEPCDALDGATPRHAMQTLGTEWGRTHLGEMFWINAALRSALSKGVDLIVFDDVRFENEATAIWDRGGHVFRIINPRLGPLVDSHRSEQADFPCPVIENDGAPDDLRRAVQQIMASAS